MRARKQALRMRTKDLRTQERQACINVMVAHNDIGSTMGQTQAMDYSRNTGGQNAQYRPNDGMFIFIDYRVDVQTAAKDALTPAEYAVFKKKLLDTQIELTVQDEFFLRVQEKLGRLFIGRGLHPVMNYFKEKKK